MALTIASTTPQSGDVWGRQKTRIVNVTFENPYVAGGHSFTPANAGLASFTFVAASPDASALPGYVVQYNYTTQKLQVFTDRAVNAASPLAEASGSPNLSTLVVRVLCVGH